MRIATLVSYLSIAGLAVNGQTNPGQFPGELGPFDLQLFGAKDFVGTYVIPRNRDDRRFASTNMTWETSPLPFNRSHFYWDPATKLLRVRGRDPEGTYEMSASYVPNSNNGDLWPLRFANRGLQGFREMSGWDFSVAVPDTKSTTTIASASIPTATATISETSTASTPVTSDTPAQPTSITDLKDRKLTLWTDDNFWVCNENDAKGNPATGIYHSMKKDIDSKGCIAIVLKVALSK